MKEGMYTISYQGPTGQGWGILVFDTGVVWGVDIGGAQYDGTYDYNQRTEQIDATFTLTIPPGTSLVVETTASNQPRKTTVQVSLPRDFDKPTTGVANVLGFPVQFIITKARDAPNNY